MSIFRLKIHSITSGQFFALCSLSSEELRQRAQHIEAPVDWIGSALPSRALVPIERIECIRVGWIWRRIRAESEVAAGTSEGCQRIIVVVVEIIEVAAIGASVAAIRPLLRAILRSVLLSVGRPIATTVHSVYFQHIAI